MPFVKLDCGLLDSTLWMDTMARDVFITSLLMAEPMEVKEPMEQINVRDLNYNGFIVPIGWYGFVPAAGTGIIHRSGVPLEQGLKALEILGAEDPESRTPDFGGRRMVRVNGGYLILNFVKYREKDATSADRSKRWRERQKIKATRVTDTPTPVIRHQAEAEAEAEAEEIRNTEWVAIAPQASQGPIKLKTTIKKRFVKPTIEQIESYGREIGFSIKGQSFCDYYQTRGWKLAGGLPMADWKAAVRTWKAKGEERSNAAVKPKVDYLEINRLNAERRLKEEQEVANRVLKS